MSDGISGEQTQALVLLTEALDAVGVRYYLTGSVPQASTATHA